MSLKKKSKSSFWDRFKASEEKDFVVNLSLEEVLKLIDRMKSNRTFYKQFFSHREYYKIKVQPFNQGYIVEILQNFKLRLTVNLTGIESNKAYVHLTSHLEQSTGCFVLFTLFVLFGTVLLIAFFMAIFTLNPLAALFVLALFLFQVYLRTSIDRDNNTDQSLEVNFEEMLKFHEQSRAPKQEL